MSCPASRTAVQMLDQARADAVAVKQQLRDTQLMLADSQQALAAAAGVADELRVRISHLEQKQQQADDAATAQQQHQQQQAEVAVSTPATNKAQVGLLPASIEHVMIRCMVQCLEQRIYNSLP